MSQKFGKGMWFFTWISLLVLLMVFFQDSLDQKLNPNKDLSNNGSSTVTLQRNRSGHYIAPGRINGVKVQFLLDTGATTISIPQNVADKIGLSGGMRHQVSTANGTISVFAVKLDRVSLGGITQREIAAHINPHMEGSTVLLGMSFMKNLELIQQGKTLTLTQPY